MSTISTIRSVSASQDEILRAIMTLHDIDRFDADVTYGNGAFYKHGIPEPVHRFDLDPQQPGVVECDSGQLPLDDASIGSVVFDPPFLTYVRSGRTGNGRMLMAGRFGGYWRYDELEAHYRATLKEAARVLRRGGVLVFKCQDIVHNHRLHATHARVIEWASEAGFDLDDLFVLTANHRLPAPNRAGRQRHARIHHSYFLVLTRKGGAR
jgi:tRNA G10  N-methylase Trm11